MKLAYVVNANMPPDDWAHTIQIMNMCKAFAETGADVILFVPKRKLPSIDPFEFYSMKRTFKIEFVSCVDIFLRSPNPFFYWLRLISFYISVRTNLLFRKFDFIYSRDLYAPILFPGVVIERHSITQKFSLLARIAFRMAGSFVVLTTFLRERLIKAGIHKEKIFVAPDAVDIALFEEENRERKKVSIPGIFPGDFVVGYIGTLKTMGMEKGVADALQALKELPESFKLLIVGGEEPDISFYKKMADDWGVSARAIFFGRVPHQDIPAYAHFCNVLVAPFPENEHYSYFMSPLKIFEYMASNRPIVSTLLPSIQEILSDGENAVLIPPGNYHELAIAIKKIEANYTFGKNISDRAYKDVIEKYTWNMRAEKILSFMKKNHA